MKWVVLKTKIKNTLKTIPQLVHAVRFIIKVKNSFSSPYGAIDEAELAIFNAIRNDIEVVFDVGARLNTDYLGNSTGGGAPLVFYLFEPNPSFYKGLCERVDVISASASPDARVVVTNSGLGDKAGLFTYYEDVQSFVKDNGFRKSEDGDGKTFEIRTLDNFCAEQGVGSIDFLKIDVEGLDYQVLLGGSVIIKETVNYCQFEFGVGQTADGSTNTPEKYYQFFGDDFDLYYVRNPRHPIHKEVSHLTELTALTGQFRDKIEKHLYAGSGCNILAVRKSHRPPLEFGKLLSRLS